MTIRTPSDRYYPFLLGMGLILSPQNFAAWGNAAGLTGSFFPIVLISVLAVHLLTAHSYQALWAAEPREEPKASPGPSGIDPLLILLWGSRISLAVCAAPLILVSAGFIFNELFLYWFPNFGFAYGMLILFLLLNLLGEKTFSRTQALLVGSALAGLGLISAIGLGSAFFSAEAATRNDPGSGPAFPGFAIALLLFVGFDLADLHRSQQDRSVSQRPFQMAIVLILSGLSFLLWGTVSLLYVSAVNLTETTVAHVVAARAVFGEPGARIMGVVVLAGAGAAINALLFSIPRLLARFPGGVPEPASAAPLKKPAAVFLILLGASIALVLALGLAGESELETALKAALLLWLTQNAWIHLRVLTGRSRDRTGTLFNRAVPLAGLALLTGSLVALILRENRPAQLLIFYLAFLLISCLLGFIILKYKTRGKEVNR
ncbi:MAG: hypothetical protein HY892_03400 [Deltaproteobacteria bacterium]|nr:hypothetical protein [Deltaproteobacteria bacterium]